MLWDVFCRVIDNYGDVGVCWRLAADLGQRGHQVRLWLDDPSALAWMAPDGAPGVTARPWRDDTAWPEPGDVVIEAFGCDPPPPFVAAMAARSPSAPVWINLEYLSAEDYVERSHALASPQWHGPGAGLVKHFFYPGFTAGTGGLLREPGLLEARARFDAARWLAQHGWAPQPGEQVVSLFCYRNPCLAHWLDAWTAQATLLLVTPGLAAAQVAQWLQDRGHPVADPGRAESPTEVARLRIAWLPALPQTEFDRLLWSCDLNLVRGEDSFVRAQWAGQPFLWQIYPQHDNAHVAKLDAFLDHHLGGGTLDAAQLLAQRQWWRQWNGLVAAQGPAPSASAPWAAQNRIWRDKLAAQTDLTTRLVDFVQLQVRKAR